MYKKAQNQNKQRAKDFVKEWLPGIIGGSISGIAGAHPIANLIWNNPNWKQRLFSGLLFGGIGGIGTKAIADNIFTENPSLSDKASAAIAGIKESWGLGDSSKQGASAKGGKQEKGKAQPAKDPQTVLDIIKNRAKQLSSPGRVAGAAAGAAQPHIAAIANSDRISKVLGRLQDLTSDTGANIDKSNPTKSRQLTQKQKDQGEYLLRQNRARQSYKDRAGALNRTIFGGKDYKGQYYLGSVPNAVLGYVSPGAVAGSMAGDVVNSGLYTLDKTKAQRPGIYNTIKLLTTLAGGAGQWAYNKYSKPDEAVKVKL